MKKSTATATDAKCDGDIDAKGYQPIVRKANTTRYSIPNTARGASTLANGGIVDIVDKTRKHAYLLPVLLPPGSA